MIAPLFLLSSHGCQDFTLHEYIVHGLFQNFHGQQNDHVTASLKVVGFRTMMMMLKYQSQKAWKYLGWMQFAHAYL